jgi:hypothetical protein
MAVACCCSVVAAGQGGSGRASEPRTRAASARREPSDGRLHAWRLEREVGEDAHRAEHARSGHTTDGDVPPRDGRSGECLAERA